MRERLARMILNISTKRVDAYQVLFPDVLAKISLEPGPGISVILSETTQISIPQLKLV